MLAVLCFPVVQFVVDLSSGCRGFLCCMCWQYLMFIEHEWHHDAVVPKYFFEGISGSHPSVPVGWRTSPEDRFAFCEHVCTYQSKLKFWSTTDKRSGTWNLWNIVIVICFPKLLSYVVWRSMLRSHWFLDTTHSLRGFRILERGVLILCPLITDRQQPLHYRLCSYYVAGLIFPHYGVDKWRSTMHCP